MQPIRLAIVGVGKIARDQHLPSIQGNAAFRLSASVSRNASIAGVSGFGSLEELLAGGPDVDAIAICTPPQYHYEAAKLALLRGKHVLMEKPPCTSLAQLTHLTALAEQGRRTLYQTWHSRHAHGVAPAVRWLRGRRIRRIGITWKEDVQRWHPGQDWIWRAGGFGVLDPGINALSILTLLVPEPIFSEEVEFFVPSNCETPIAATLALRTDSGVPIRAEMDFRHTGTQTWDMHIETDTGVATLSGGGGLLCIDGQPLAQDAQGLQNEYVSIYQRFAELIGSARSEVDARPLALVADLFMAARRVPVEPFYEAGG